MRLTEERMKHAHAVAEYMYKHYREYDCKKLSQDEIYALGLNHNIGYIDGAEEHNAKGALLFANTRFGEYIGWLEYTPREFFTITGNITAPGELVLLWTADFSIECNGEDAGKEIGFDKRLKNIEKRLGKATKAYSRAKETINWLIIQGR